MTARSTRTASRLWVAVVAVQKFGKSARAASRRWVAVVSVRTAASRLWVAVVAEQTSASHSEAVAEVVRAVSARDTANVSRRT